jgi:hypothetical protein
MKRLVFAVAVVCLPALASAQVDRATLTGVVRDPSNAVVAAATITITHLATGIESKSTTTGEGTYLAVNLLPGESLVEVQASGFRKFAQTIQLEVGNRASIDFSLTVGSLTETCTAIARCRTTSCSTAWTAIPSRRTCRS